MLSLVFPTPTCPGSCPGLLTRRSPPRLFTAAARAGLRPAPESRSRRAYRHLLRSFTTRFSFHLLLLPCFCSTQAGLHFVREPESREIGIVSTHLRSEPSPAHFAQLANLALPGWRPSPHPATGHRSAFRKKGQLARGLVPRRAVQISGSPRFLRCNSLSALRRAWPNKIHVAC